MISRDPSFLHITKAWKLFPSNVSSALLQFERRLLLQ